MYTVKQVAEMLDVDEETVRRWIRNGEMDASSTGRKEGYKISLLDLNKFYDSHPKYSKEADIKCIKIEIQQTYKEIRRLAKRLDNLTQELINKMES